MAASWRRLALALLLVTLASLWLVGMAAAEGPLDDEARRIAQNLACPICSGQSVADSGSTLAADMRVVIRKKLEAGESSQQIMDYFVQRYGEGVLMQPKVEGFTSVVWWLPILGLIIGIAALVYMFQHWRKSRRSSSVPNLSRMRQEDLTAYERRLERELEA